MCQINQINVTSPVVDRFCPHPDCEKQVARHMLCCYEHWMELPPEWRIELGLMVGEGHVLDAYIMAEFYWGESNGTKDL